MLLMMLLSVWHKALYKLETPLEPLNRILFNKQLAGLVILKEYFSLLSRSSLIVTAKPPYFKKLDDILYLFWNSSNESILQLSSRTSQQ